MYKRQGIEHFTGLKLDFLFKAADLLAKIAQVAEQNALPLPQRCLLYTSIFIWCSLSTVSKVPPRVLNKINKNALINPF